MLRGADEAVAADSGQIDSSIVNWARCVPIEQIPGLLVFLTSRLLTQPVPAHNDQSPRETPESLLTAGALAEQLGVPESWVRSEEREGRIPSVRIGKYVRFRRADVERALAQRTRPGPKNR